MEVHQIVWGLIGSLLPVIGAAIAISNWLNSKFERLGDRLDSAVQTQAVGREQINAKLELHEYRIHANQELIEHRSKRLQGDIDQLKGWLSTHGFKPRNNEPL